MNRKVICKVHDWLERITHVGIEGEGVRPMLEVWERIRYRKEEFYTQVNNRRAKVYAVERSGVKYLTTHADGVTLNNLDELPNCR